MHDALAQAIHELAHVLRELKHDLTCSKSQAGLATKSDLAQLESNIMISQTDLAAGLTKIQTQIAKVAKEQADRSDTLIAKVAELQAIVDAGGTIGPEVETALAGVTTAMQALDDVIPDAPAEVPAVTPAGPTKVSGVPMQPN